MDIGEKMEKWNGTDEEFLVKHGWKKVEGWRIDLDSLRDFDQYDYFYIEELDDFVIKCSYWTNEKDYPETAMEDESQILELHYIDYIDKEGNLYDSPLE